MTFSEKCVRYARSVRRRLAYFSAKTALPNRRSQYFSLHEQRFMWIFRYVQLTRRSAGPSLMLSFYTRIFKVYKLPQPPPPKKKMPSSPPKILLSLQYISNCTGKIMRRDEVGAHTATFQGIFISKTFRMGMPPNPARKLVAFSHSGVLLPQTINPRQNPARSLYLQCSISQPTQRRFLGFGGFGGKRAFLRVWRKQKKQSILSTWAILLFFIDPSYLPFPPLLRL